MLGGAFRYGCRAIIKASTTTRGVWMRAQSMGNGVGQAASSGEQAAKYPLTAIHPASSIPRLPLLTAGTSEALAFAEESRTDDFWSRLRTSFAQVHSLAAINIPARNTNAIQSNAALKQYLLRLPRLNKSTSLKCEDDPQRRVLLLNVHSEADLSSDAQQFLQAEGEKDDVRLNRRELRVGYDYFGVDETLSAVLPEELMSDGTPNAFTITGHIAHLNLREEYAPYRFVIGQVIMDKNANVIETVVNKLDTIHNEYRFFDMERLAGKDEYTVTVSESNCTFLFDFRTVYWNSRLHTEHARLTSSLQPFEVVSDVMAGVGPFAVPAAKQGCYVLANDLNPASYDSLELNSKKNHVEGYLQSYCKDGRAFVADSIKRCWQQPFEGVPTTAEGRAEVLGLSLASSRQRARQEHARRQAQKQGGAKGPAPIERGPARRLIDHFIMNLPATAIEFLDAFRGAYKGIAGDDLEAELTRRQAAGESVWPMVHVYCFTKMVEQPYEDICQRANAALGIPPDSPHRLVPPPISSSTGNEAAHAAPTPELRFHCVRSVAPNKDMYCLTFRLSRAILFDAL